MNHWLIGWLNGNGLRSKPDDHLLGLFVGLPQTGALSASGRPRALLSAHKTRSQRPRLGEVRVGKGTAEHTPAARSGTPECSAPPDRHNNDEGISSSSRRGTHRGH